MQAPLTAVIFVHCLLCSLGAARLCAQSCPPLYDPMDHGLPGSSVHGTLQARILEWVPISFSRGSSWPRDRTRISFWQASSSRLSHQGSPLRTAPMYTVKAPCIFTSRQHSMHFTYWVNCFLMMVFCGKCTYRHSHKWGNWGRERSGDWPEVAQPTEWHSWRV